MNTKRKTVPSTMVMYKFTESKLLNFHDSLIMIYDHHWRWINSISSLASCDDLSDTSTAGSSKRAGRKTKRNNSILSVMSVNLCLSKRQSIKSIRLKSPPDHTEQSAKGFHIFFPPVLRF